MGYVRQSGEIYTAKDKRRLIWHHMVAAAITHPGRARILLRLSMCMTYPQLIARWLFY
jgi:hypothetical protein